MNTLNIPYTIKPVKSHTKIKEDLLTEIQNSEGKILSQTDNYYSDNISKYDWHLNMDFNRPWVKFFEPYLKNELLCIILKYLCNIHLQLKQNHIF